MMNVRELVLASLAVLALACGPRKVKAPVSQTRAFPAAEVLHVNPLLLIVAGALAGNFIHAGIASINAMLAGCICYLVYDKATRR